MRFTIVTISYNQAPFLRDCIESVLSQEGCEVEYILVDPGSSDGSREIIRSYGNRLIAVYELDSGPADGLNHGFEKATGDIYGFINADDYLLSGALRVVADYFSENGRNHFVSGCGYIEHGDGTRRRVVPTPMTRLSYLYGACTVFQQGTFFPAEMFQAIGGFNADNHTFWDGELFFRFVRAGYRHVVINADVAVFRIYQGSITGSKRYARKYKLDHRRIFEEDAGRRWTVLDAVVGYLFRLSKYVRRQFCEEKYLKDL